MGRFLEKDCCNVCEALSNSAASCDCRSSVLKARAAVVVVERYCRAACGTRGAEWQLLVEVDCESLRMSSMD